MNALNQRIAAALRWLAVFSAVVLATQVSAAIAPETIRDLAFGEGDARGKAIAAIVASGDAAALPLLEAVLAGEIKTAGEDRVLQVKGEEATDLLTGKSVKKLVLTGAIIATKATLSSPAVQKYLYKNAC